MCVKCLTEILAVITQLLVFMVMNYNDYMGKDVLKSKVESLS